MDTQSGAAMTGPSNAVESPDTALVMTRVFDAPRPRVFQAFSESRRLAQWWGPKGFTITVLRCEFRPGGLCHYSMSDPDGHVMWGRFVYREIASPERIVWVNSFADEAGNLAPVPFSETWPPEMLCTVKLDEQDGKTLLTLRVVALNASAEQHATFLEGHASMQEGFGGTWDQLVEYLAKERAHA
jgi:uncharacterized protein YndB with AHSA1/START domain